jgi:uncharacterized protein YceH (UPF0502 family)
MEKSVLTPDQYPLSLNALVNACNQKSSRDPVMSLEPGAVQRAVNDLIERKLIMVQPYGGRVDKYQQRFCNTQFATIKLSPPELAVITLLLLRGPQTPGELKSHSGRLHEFGDVTEVDAVLEALHARTEPLVARLPREARRKDHAWTHVFGEPVVSAPAEPAERERGGAPAAGIAAAAAPVTPTAGTRVAAAAPESAHTRAPAEAVPAFAAGEIAALERRVAHLERELAAIKQALGIE